MLPPIDFPPYQGHCVDVSIIDGAKSHMLARMLLGSDAADGEQLCLAHHCFLIESQHQDRKIIFDLAFMKDADDHMPPALRKLLSGGGGEPVMGIDDLRDVPSQLKQHGYDLNDIDAIVWSHAHWDHVGDPSAFPETTDLVVGPTFKANCLPGYPANDTAMVLESAVQARNVRELSFSGGPSPSAPNKHDGTSLTIGGFEAIDYFDDGSCFLLRTPGHTTHHLAALLRTTPDSWILAAGDACHSIAQLRPSIARPLPKSHSSGDRPRNQPFYNLAPGMQEDMKQSLLTLERLMAFDGNDDVFVVLAHDATLLDVLPLFPEKANAWKTHDLAAQSRWLFLKQFPDVAEV